MTVALLLLSTTWAVPASAQSPGVPLPELSAATLERIVDRSGSTDFDVTVTNQGGAAGKFPLQARSSDPSWPVAILDENGNEIADVTLMAGASRVVIVRVHAPAFVPENTATSIEVTAFTEDFSQSSRLGLRSTIHDYGVAVEARPAHRAVIAGRGTEFLLTVQNLGNDDDTLNLSADLLDLPGWRVEFAATEVRLEPAESRDVTVTLVPSFAPIPEPGEGAVAFHVGTRGGQQVGIPHAASARGDVVILDYRSADVDRDGLLELAVDVNQDRSDGFEAFVEIFPEGAQSEVIASATPPHGGTSFFLRAGGPAGLPTVWFDPADADPVYTLRHIGDATGDGRAEFFVDLDRDGRDDAAYDPAGGMFNRALGIDAFGDGRVQFLVEVDGSGRLDRFFDPGSTPPLATRTLPVGSDRNLIGIDTDGSGNLGRIYDLARKRAVDVVILSPTDGAVVYGPVTLTGVATSSAGSVDVSVDGEPARAANGTTAWTFLWSDLGAANGTHTFVAKAGDSTAAVSVTLVRNATAQVAAAPNVTRNAAETPSTPAPASNAPGFGLSTVLVGILVGIGIRRRSQ